MTISAIILSKNEENNIERCLKSITFCNEIIVIDDLSTDKTIEKILKFESTLKNKKIKIYQRELKGDFASQRNFGLTKARGDWLIFIDADEELSFDLIKEIKKLISENYQHKVFNAYYLKRRDWFLGHELRFGEVLKARKEGISRLVKKNSGKWVGNVHEIFYTSDNFGQLKGWLNHYPHQTLKDFINDINFYSSLKAEELYTHGKSTNILQICLYPLFKFVFNYFILLGFLDGTAGFCYSFLMSFHSFLVRSKLFLKKNI